MDWSAFIGAAVGTILAILIAIGAFLVWDHFDRKKSLNLVPSKPSLDDLLESHLEEFIVRKFDMLFPQWKIFDDSIPDNAITNNSKPRGVRYRTDAGEIDILCLDDQGNFVVVELKRKRAPDRVVSQINRYIAWVEKNLADPSQRVRGIVIANSFNPHLLYSLSKNNEIDLWKYNWELVFNRGVAIKTVGVKEIPE